MGHIILRLDRVMADRENEPEWNYRQELALPGEFIQDEERPYQRYPFLNTGSYL